MQHSDIPQPIQTCVAAYLDWMGVQNYAQRSIEERQKILGYFQTWCRQTGITNIAQIQRVTVEAWQKHLHQQLKKSGGFLSITVQHNRLVQLQAFFTWLLKNGHVQSNPCSAVVLPKLPARLPRHILSTLDIEVVLILPDTSTPTGLRDRALLELLWSTGIRRRESADLTLRCIDWHRAVLTIRQGKGARDRVVPIGQRALYWLRRYLEQARPRLVNVDSPYLFVTVRGRPFNRNSLGNLVHGYFIRSGVATGGSCHVFRHSMATAMLDHGADIRFVQEMLGHQRLETTQVYTHVSIEKLKTVHRTTHPAENGWCGGAAGSLGIGTIEVPPKNPLFTPAPLTAGRIASLRHSCGLSQPEFARLLNVPTEVLPQLESGLKLPTGPLLRLLQILRYNPTLMLKIHAALPA
jgi:integrase/recombinase XerD